MSRGSGREAGPDLDARARGAQHRVRWMDPTQEDRGSFVSAAEDLLRLGTSAFESWSSAAAAVLYQTTATGGHRPSGVDLGEMLQVLTALAQTWRPSGQWSGVADLAQAVATPGRARLVQLLSQAYPAWLESGFGYWRDLAETHRRHVPGLLKQLATAESTPAAAEELELRLLIDATRAYIRELAEVSTQDARMFVQKIAQIDYELRKLADPDAEMSSPTRHHKAKD